MNLDKVEYPVCFGKFGFIGGMVAACDIKKGECFIEVPESATISRKLILNSELRIILEKHPEIFDKHVETDMALVIYFIFERMKGESSKW